MRFSYQLPAALIGVAASIVLVQPQVAVALSPDEVGRIAKSITVRIESSKQGSGVIIKQQGNTYTVLTAAHVVERAGQYAIVTPDDSRYPLNYSTVKKLSGVDLAVVQFTSSKSYSVAKIGNSDSVTEGKAAYVAGFPVATAAINRSIYQFTDGNYQTGSAVARFVCF